MKTATATNGPWWTLADNQDRQGPIDYAAVYRRLLKEKDLQLDRIEAALEGRIVVQIEFYSWAQHPLPLLLRPQAWRAFRDRETAKRERIKQRLNRVRHLRVEMGTVMPKLEEMVVRRMCIDYPHFVESETFHRLFHKWKSSAGSERLMHELSRARLLDDSPESEARSEHRQDRSGYI